MGRQGNMRLTEYYMSDQDILLISLLPLSVVYVFNIIATLVPFRNFIFGLDFHADSLDVLINFLMCQFRIQLCGVDNTFAGTTIITIFAST